MQVTVERHPGSVAELKIYADEAEFADAVEAAYRKVTRDITIPGFRKGKAPRHVIERMVGREAMVEEAGREMMDGLYQRAIKQEELIPVGDPRVGILQDDPLGFQVLVEVFPTVTLGDYLSVRVEPREVEITDDEVEEVLAQLEKRHATFEDVEEQRSPVTGDQVIIDYAVFDGDEPFQERIEDAEFIIGESGIFDALQEALTMMQPGTEAEVSLAFEEDDESVAPDLRGKELRYTMTLKQIRKRNLHPRNDELAALVNPEWTSWDTLVEEARKDLLRNKATEQRNQVVTETMDAMAESSEVEVPTAMVEREIDDELTQFRSRLAQQRTTMEEYLKFNGQTEEELRDEFRPNAARRLRNSLVMQEIAKAEELAVNEDDIAGEIDRLIGNAPNAERMRQIYQSDHFRGLMENELFDRKLTARVLEIATEGVGPLTGAGAIAWEEAQNPPRVEVASTSATTETETEADAEGADADAGDEAAAETETADVAAVADDAAAETDADAGEAGDASTGESDDAAAATDEVAAEADADADADTGDAAAEADADDAAKDEKSGE